MKILMVSSGFSPLVGGVETFALNIARGLGRAGCKVCVLTAVGADGPERVHDVSIVRTPAPLNRKFLKTLPLIWRAQNLHRQERFDHLLAMVWTHDGIVASVLAAVTGLPYVVVAHGSEILQHRRGIIRRLMMRKVFADASLVIANSHFTCDLLTEDGVEPRRTMVLNPPIDAPEAVTDAERRQVDERFQLSGKRVILTVARLVKRKGNARVLRALPRLSAKYSDLVYVMAGDGECRAELLAMAEAEGVGHCIRLTGRVSAAELKGLYGRALAYVSPSIDVDGDVEGFGLSLAEAGSYGVPVVAGRSGGVADAVVDGETGILVETDDELVAAITQLLDDPGFARTLGAAARKRALTEFSIDRQGARLAAAMSAPLSAHPIARPTARGSAEL